jgi:hypothetical protein
MPNFYVRCKNTAEPTCAVLIPTGLFTALTDKAEIKKLIDTFQPMKITCRSCGFTATYSPEDFGISLDS